MPGPRERGAIGRHDAIPILGPQRLALAETVIRKSDRAHAADAVLREVLRESGGLTRQESRLISGAVFGYFRWLGWLDPAQSLSQRLHAALDLGAHFERDPSSFGGPELRSRAVPAWLGAQVPAQLAPGWAAQLQSPPRIWIRARPGKGGPLGLELGDCTPAGPGMLADALEYRGDKDLFRSQEFQEGRFELQDLSSQAVAWICGPRPGETWWDVCAGEGGKTLHLGDLMENRGLIWATDRTAWRLDRLKRRAARARLFNYRSALWDVKSGKPLRTRFDGVLIDAPCSGIGTWQRNPHARWTTTPEDVAELADLQRKLLMVAADAVKPGGRLVYSVCTLANLETSEVASWFETQRRDFEPLPIASPFSIADPPSARWWLPPTGFGANGMFVASWRRSPKS